MTKEQQTVAGLIARLSTLPPTAVVFLPTGEFIGDEATLRAVLYRKEGHRGVPSNSVLLDWKNKP